MVRALPDDLAVQRVRDFEEQYPDAGARDEDNERFWEKLSEVFQGTIEMIREDAERQGIDLDSRPTRRRTVAEDRRRESAVKEHECPRAAKRYADMVDEWFKSAKPLFAEKKVALESQARMQLPGADPAGEAARLKDVVEVVQYYQHQIWVKLMRAVDGLLEEAVGDSSRTIRRTRTARPRWR